jgi:hypothetical protein
MAEHALFREFSEWNDPQAPLQQVEGVKGCEQPRLCALDAFCFLTQSSAFAPHG